jgi:hypothetical protein
MVMIAALLILMVLVAVFTVQGTNHDTKQPFSSSEDPSQPVQDNDPELVKPTPGYKKGLAERVARSQKVNCEEFKFLTSQDTHMTPQELQRLFELQKRHPYGFEKPADC